MKLYQWFLLAYFAVVLLVGMALSVSGCSEEQRFGVLGTVVQTYCSKATPDERAAIRARFNTYLQKDAPGASITIACPEAE